MAIRTIRVDEDPILRKVSKSVKKFDNSLHELLTDMADTMYEADGVGLAAPQVGVLKRIYIIDIGEGLVEFINPEIIEADGEQIGDEGCLSIPRKYGQVKRPFTVKVRAQDRNGDFFEIIGEELFARAMCHEGDHLEGKVFIDMVEGDIFEEVLEEIEHENPEMPIDAAQQLATEITSDITNEITNENGETHEEK
ncbi:MAG: peptide deformylase [Epulopiscium sp. Nuni2H_MBin001]|nr:MAG: peptide deformylase [Epulopiscium sp. Nuni2H_MBin001]